MSVSVCHCVRSFLLFALTFANSLIAKSALAAERVSGVPMHLSESGSIRAESE
jgi:hypothetical protein